MKIELTKVQQEYVLNVLGLSFENKVLGILCKRKHEFINTGLNLKYRSGGCYECSLINNQLRRSKKEFKVTNKKGSRETCIPKHLIKFLSEIYPNIGDFQSYYFGKLCKNKHNILNTKCSFRLKSNGDCLECVKERTRKANKTEKYKTNKTRYRLENKDKENERRRIRYRLNGKSESAKEAAKRYDLKNKEKNRLRWKEYDKKNPEKRLQRSLRRYYLRKGKKEFIPDNFYNEALNYFAIYRINGELAHYGCAYCKCEINREAKTLHWDHVVPLKRGGDHAIHNLIPTCKDCNMRKHISDPLEWFYEQNFWMNGQLDKIQNFLNIELLGNFEWRIRN